MATGTNRLISPETGCKSPAINRSSEVFPAPFAPRMTIRSGPTILREKSRMTGFSGTGPPKTSNISSTTRPEGESDASTWKRIFLIRSTFASASCNWLCARSALRSASSSPRPPVFCALSARASSNNLLMPASARDLRPRASLFACRSAASCALSLTCFTSR